MIYFVPADESSSLRVTTVAPKVGEEKKKEKEGLIPVEVDEENEIGINEKQHPDKKRISVLRSSAILIKFIITELQKKIIKVTFLFKLTDKPLIATVTFIQVLFIFISSNSPSVSGLCLLQ